MIRIWIRIRTCDITDPDADTVGPNYNVATVPVPGSCILDKFFSGFLIPNPYFGELSDIFLGKSSLKIFVSTLKLK